MIFAPGLNWREIALPQVGCLHCFRCYTLTCPNSCSRQSTVASCDEATSCDEVSRKPGNTPQTHGVIRVVRNKFVIAVIGIVVVIAVVGTNRPYSWYNRFPWLRFAVAIHAHRGSLDCGHLAQGEANEKPLDTSIECAVNAQHNHVPFIITFYVYGIDEQIWSGIVGDARGNATEYLYAMGMIRPANTLLKHPCAAPARLQIEPPTIYGIPRLHCTPWPAPRLERDWIFW